VAQEDMPSDKNQDDHDVLRTVIDYLENAIWVADADDCIVLVNTPMQDLADVQASAVRGLDVTSAFPAQSDSRFLHSYKKARQSLKPTAFTASFVSSSGIRKDVDGSLIPRTRNKHYDGMICILRDSEQRLRLITEASAEVIWQLDTTGQVIYVSAAVQQILGYTHQEALRLHFSAFFAVSEAGRAAETFGKAITGEAFQLLKFQGRTKSGTLVPLEVSVSPIEKDGAIAGVQGNSQEYYQAQED
jgi:PAS domain S-box-containing protein